MASFGENRNFENIEIENVGTQESETQPIPTEEGGAGRRVPNSDIFKVPFKKTPKGDNKFVVSCNYCSQVYKFNHGGGYGMFQRHLQLKHPRKMGLGGDQT